MGCRSSLFLFCIFCFLLFCLVFVFVFLCVVLFLFVFLFFCFLFFVVLFGFCFCFFVCCFVFVCVFVFFVFCFCLFVFYTRCHLPIFTFGIQISMLFCRLALLAVTKLLLVAVPLLRGSWQAVAARYVKHFLGGPKSTKHINIKKFYQVM